jgi:GntR family transcriptional regulator, rspAB operon transcriptional repressor
MKFDHGQRREALVRSLLAEVFQGKLRAGQHLVAQDLADRYAVSPTPIREALITLAGVGVVDLLPNRGAVVRTVGAKDIVEVCQVRRLLECEAARRAAGLIPAEKLAAIEADTRRIAEADPDAELVAFARQADSRLHDLIAGHCGNATLAREISRLTLLFRAVRDVSWESVESRKDFRRLPGEASEHLAIIVAVRDNNPKAAAKAMGRHIRAGERYWTKALFG